jgi:hypothetical protein
MEPSTRTGKLSGHPSRIARPGPLELQTTSALVGQPIGLIFN